MLLWNLVSHVAYQQRIISAILLQLLTINHRWLCSLSNPAGPGADPSLIYVVKFGAKYRPCVRMCACLYLWLLISVDVVVSCAQSLSLIRGVWMKTDSRASLGVIIWRSYETGHRMCMMCMVMIQYSGVSIQYS